MKGRHITKKLVKNASIKIVPYNIRTLYSQDADQLNVPADPILFLMNKQSISKMIAKLKTTAAQAQCAVLANNQATKQSQMFVINKNINNQKIWLSPKFSQSTQFQCFINAQILTATNPITVQKQQSVSFPFINADIRRFNSIKTEFVNEKFQPQAREFTAYEALAFQQAWDYSVGRHILDWRLHLGDIRVQQNVREQLPKTTTILEQYSRQIKSMLHRFPNLAKIPQQLANKQQVKWLQERNNNQVISIEQDYMLRIHKHYRKQMLIFLERQQHNLA